MSFNCLIDRFPTDYKGYKINTSFRAALKAIEILDNPQYKNTNNDVQSLAVYLTALGCIFIDKDVIAEEKLGFSDAVAGMMWWLHGWSEDKVERYWKEWRIPPDVEDVSFSMDAYNGVTSDRVVISRTGPTGEVTQNERSRVAIAEYSAPDGTTRYFKDYAEGCEPFYDFYEDRSLIYSAFYKIYRIDLDCEDLHWFKFNLLLAELLSIEGTVLRRKVEVRTFDPSRYDRKTQSKFIEDGLKAKRENRVLGYLPYIKSEE